MAEYIEREEALKILENMRLDYENNDCPVHTLCEDYMDALETAEDKLNTLIAADVRPERHGEWLVSGECYECSECGGGSTVNTNPYCWKCGAKMDGKDGESE